MIDRLVRVSLLVALLLPAGLLWLAHPLPAYADSFVVTNTNDSGPGSLRQAILAANAHPNGPTEPDTIRFAIPPALCTTFIGVCTIAPTSALPTIIDPVWLLGRTQGGEGYISRPLIELNGANAGDFVDGLTIAAGTSQVTGFVINRFRGNGIVLTTRGENSVIGSYVGTDATGNVAQGNVLAGLLITNSSNNTLGADSFSAVGRNVISANSVGIHIGGGSDETRIFGNLIGTNATGALPLGNASNGITMSGGSRTRVGEPGNIVAFNGANGVAVLNGAVAMDNVISGNRIFQNGALAIDLGEPGVTLNDLLDGDIGANGLQNFPVLTSARPGDGGTRITGALHSLPNTSYNVDLYLSPSCDPSGFGEADVSLGEVSATTDEQGTAAFSVKLRAVAIGQIITSTATPARFDPSGGGELPASTSELSACRAVTRAGIALGPTGPQRTTEGGGSVAYTVVLQDQPTADVTISLSSSDTSEGTIAPATLVFTPASWNVPQTVTVTGIDDTVADGDQEYTLRVGPASSTDPGYHGLDLEDPALTNTDNEGTPTLSIADVAVAEGNAGTASATFAVSLAPASIQTVTVRYATADDTATAPGDYTATSDTLTFGPGETSKTVAVPVVGDPTVEPDEAFVVALSTPTNAAIGRGQARGTIRNDDAQAAAQPCTPRPSPRIESRQIGPGRLQVTVAVQTTQALPANALQRLDFVAADNARVEILGAATGTPGGPATSPGGPRGTAGNFSLTPPSPTSSATFIVQRQQPGPFKVSFVVVDACHGSAGPFNSFVGGGSGVQ